MFDAITPREPEDMFEHTDDQIVSPNTSSSTPVQATSSPASAPPSPIFSEPCMSTGKIILFVAGAVLVVAISGFISYYVLSARESVVPAIVTQEPTEQTTKPAEENPVIEQPVVDDSAVVDTDKDGLTDEEEEILGTSPRSSDTDRDELYDYEEVRVYHTNPLSKDSDDDGYEDGVEIAGGYDPNGLGKLLELPSVE
ncbi:MAG: Binary exotoxin B/Anthrax toxin B moiety protective antigen [Candidatus Uhrbacteria bacterium GW2011_GWE2_46_68]|uniref:Binary exotoxin B/Anthrax toxin B moiety protective antigen n=2 Tax=Candidatus Uhriibacteriota TaxID=1752732 RepID=A0A0G1Q6J6_9BACT|nr:MAG: Binary exotoxin B/Anthrax toxin B moiety protective antigen [Candidatus Uhrbacteria bacterium GW2011_GWF2_46_218]KKU40614.1 MAG: Binary exotoxin B/Anthrax toxin B moiety protective antigen [Candidatus Uhrbacteria bacterium GW2011_GWE2_46_68]